MDFNKLKVLYEKMNETKAQHEEISNRYKKNLNVVDPGRKAAVPLQGA